MFQSILDRLRSWIKTADLLTDRMADCGVHLWHSLLCFLGYFTGDLKERAKELWAKFSAWFNKVTDGEYDPEYEDDIIVKLWEKKFGGSK